MEKLSEDDIASVLYELYEEDFDELDFEPLPLKEKISELVMELRDELD